MSEQIEETVIDGARVQYSVEGDGGPGVVLVHGFAAHRHWWDGVVRRLTPTCTVVRVDLSGHGESEHRDHYSINLWADEVLGARRAVFGASPTLLVGHSLGGRIAITAAEREGASVAGVVVFDTVFREPGPQPPTHWKAVQRVYESREAAMGRFRLVPPQELDAALLAGLAENSVRPVDGGWSWKHDYRLSPTRLVFDPVHTMTVPLTIVYGENSDLVDRHMAMRAGEMAGGEASVIEVANGRHHFIVDHAQAVSEIIEQELFRSV